MRKQRQSAISRSAWHADHGLLISWLLLLAFGLVMVASASMVISDREFGYPMHFFFRQFIYVCLGGCVMVFFSRFPIRFWESISRYLLIIAFVMLLAVLVPGIGHTVNGSRRWINLGILNVQVSEVVKFFTILFMASYLARFQDEVKQNMMGFIKPLFILGVFSVLLLLQPDFGAVAVLSATLLIMLFLSGMRLWPFAMLLLVVLAALAFLAIASPYRLERLTSFMNPWGNQYGSGYQLTQSLIAFGRGGWFGVGLGNSIQKLFYLPEAHTDFLFAVIAEELGLFGEVLLIAIYSFMLYRLFRIAHRALTKNYLFCGYFAYGSAVWLGLQMIINISVNAGLLPTKGLTLPFISYGGSSILVSCAVIGIAQRIAATVSTDEILRKKRVRS